MAKKKKAGIRKKALRGLDKSASEVLGDLVVVDVKVGNIEVSENLGPLLEIGEDKCDDPVAVNRAINEFASSRLRWDMLLLRARGVEEDAQTAFDVFKAKARRQLQEKIFKDRGSRRQDRPTMTDIEAAFTIRYVQYEADGKFEALLKKVEKKVAAAKTVKVAHAAEKKAKKIELYRELKRNLDVAKRNAAILKVVMKAFDARSTSLSSMAIVLSAMARADMLGYVSGWKKKSD